MADPYRILVTGSRDWDDEVSLALALGFAVGEGLSIDPNSAVVIVHGDCPTGADAIAARLATDHGVPVEAYPADWNEHGRAAGPIRNEQMVALGADVCLAFIGPCTSPRCGRTHRHPSHGASGCADLAERAGIPTRRYLA